MGSLKKTRKNQGVILLAWKVKITQTFILGSKCFSPYLLVYLIFTICKTTLRKEEKKKKKKKKAWYYQYSLRP